MVIQIISPIQFNLCQVPVLIFQLLWYLPVEIEAISIIPCLHLAESTVSIHGMCYILTHLDIVDGFQIHHPVPGGTKARTITPRPLSPPQLESLGCQGLPPTPSCYGWTVATNIEHSDALTWQHSAWPRLPHSPGEHVGYRPSSMSPGRFLIPKQYFKNI